jgi:hypothetical protein
VRAQNSAVARLAVETPATFELVIDLKAAKALSDWPKSIYIAFLPQHSVGNKYGNAELFVRVALAHGARSSARRGTRDGAWAMRGLHPAQPPHGLSRKLPADRDRCRNDGDHRLL